MPRTVVIQPYTCSPEEAQMKIANLLTSRGYKPYQLKTGENAWKKGTGMLTAMHYIKVEIEPGAFSLAGWVQIGVGSVGGGEMDLEGVVGAIPKKSVKKVMDEILAMFR